MTSHTTSAFARIAIAAGLVLLPASGALAEDAPPAMRWEYDPSLTIAALQAHQHYALVAVTTTDRTPTTLYFQSRELMTFDVVRCSIHPDRGARCERLK